MVELRFYTHPSLKFKDTMGVEQWAAGTTVLQYRQRTFSESVIPCLGGYGEWTEWQDVPTVSEPQERSEGK